MKCFAIWTLLNAMLISNSFTQSSGQSIVYFNGLFQRETELRRIEFYGIPKKIKDKLFEVTFYSLDSQKVAMGEYTRKNFRVRNGLFVRFDYEGNIILTVHFRKGILHGIYQKFYDNGLLADSGRINRGHQIGAWKSWHPNGQLKAVSNYELGRGFRGTQFSLLNKEFKSYYPNGKLSDSGYFRNNMKHGIWIEWIESGLIRSVGEYKNGWKKGTWKYYDNRGKLLYFRRFNSLKYDEEGVRIDLK